MQYPYMKGPAASCCAQFCEMELNLDPHTISEMLRTSQCLRDLPGLLAASSEIAPSKLREISRVCTPGTEDFWIEVARTKTCREIEKLVAITPKGGLPALQRKKSEPDPDPKVPEQGVLPVSSDPASGFPGTQRSLNGVESQGREVASLISGKLPVRNLLDQEDRRAEAGISETPLPAESPLEECDHRESEAEERVPLKLRYKFIADLEADAWAVLEDALRLAGKQSGRRDRAYLLRHLAEFFLHESRRKKEGGEQGVSPVPSAPCRLVIHEAPLSGMSWMEGPNGAHYVSESKVEEALCCGEILDLRENTGVKQQGGGPTWDGGTDVSLSGPRLKQTIPPSIRRLVFERDHGRCQMPGCRNRAFNHIHHIIPRSCPGSSHHPENLCLICSGCHQALHEGRLSVEGKAPCKLVWRNKKGRVIGGGSETGRRSRVACQSDSWGPLLPQTG